MAQVTYRGNLSAKVFPFIAEYFGPTVIVQGQDQNFQRQLTSSEDLDKDRGIPQIYYGHNVMPCAEGFQSIGYTNVLTTQGNNFNNIYLLRDTSGNEVFYSHTKAGEDYVLPVGRINWIKVSGSSVAGDVPISVATMNGQTFIYFANLGCYLYDIASNTLKQVDLSGLNETEVIGITSSAGYMIAWTDNSIAWSSTVEHAIPTDPIDFVPSLTTGAGGGNVEAAKSKITLCVPHYLGFIIYTENNAVAAVYSGNSRFPFNFREIVNCGGLNSRSLVSFDSSSGDHYAYTTSGMQRVAISQTQTVFPEITDFIAGKYFEDFDESTLTFSHQELVIPMKKAINVISDRYLVVSYGVNSLTHALVYDIVQKRFGKLKIPHVTCFEWKPLNDTTEVPRQSIGFLQSDGSIKTVDFSYTSQTSQGVMLLGKYQLARTRLLTMDEVELENIRSNNNFNLYNMVSYNGKDTQPPVAGYLSEKSGTSRVYNFRQTGINHTLVAVGSFYCSAIVLKFHINGRR